METALNQDLAGNGPGKHQVVILLVHSRTLAQDWLQRLTNTGSRAEIFRPSRDTQIRKALFPLNSATTQLDVLIAGAVSILTR